MAMMSATSARLRWHADDEVDDGMLREVRGAFSSRCDGDVYERDGGSWEASQINNAFTSLIRMYQWYLYHARATNY